MARSPDRVRNVYFLGAGFGKAAGLPNTAELLLQAHALSGSNAHWGVSVKIGERLDDAYDYFYPDHANLFRPAVPDFFQVLTTYSEIAAEGLPQGFDDRALLTDLKFVIARLLTQNASQLEQALNKPHAFLDQLIQPGNVVITTNWDLLVEKAAALRQVPLRLTGTPSDSSLVLLKLHGSIDWTLKTKAKKTMAQVHYASPKDLLNSNRQRPHSLVSGPIVRTKGALDRWTAAYQAVKGATDEPYMLTMARGKADLIKPVLAIWADAYRAISSARRLHIVGYSMPDDDVEIRTLLRAGCRRGSANPEVLVKNPAPDVHVRVRTQVHDEIQPDYAPIAPIE